MDDDPMNDSYTTEVLSGWGRTAPTAATDRSTKYTAHTKCGERLPAVAITSSPTTWITATPMFPPPALRPSAHPLSRCG